MSHVFVLDKCSNFGIMEILIKSLESIEMCDFVLLLEQYLFFAGSVNNFASYKINTFWPCVENSHVL